MRVIHLGITPLPLLSRDEARIQLGRFVPELAKNKNVLCILSIGELHPIKGFSFAIQSMRPLLEKHPQIHYIIIGEGDFRPSLEKTISDLNLQNTVHLIGHVTMASSLIQCADIFLIPSLSEAFGYVALEAGSAGIPIVASSVGGLREVIGDDGGILVPSQNAKAIEFGIETSIYDPVRTKNMKLAMKERVQSYFTKERMLEETVENYNSGS